MGTEVSMSFGEAVEEATVALKDESFGVLTTIDVHETPKEKIDVDRSPYVILGACARQFAQQTLEIGLLLPCNVIAYEEDGATKVSAMDPEAALSLAENPNIVPVAREVRQRIERVIGQLA